MKALEILYPMIDGTRKNILSNKNTYERLTFIAESIEELEELENRSCNTCKSNSCSIKRILIREDEINSNYFYCNDWENKA